MEAAAWTRNKKASGLRAAKGLFFVFCLLTLICQTSAFLDKQDLAKRRQDIQVLKERLEVMMIDQKSLSSILELVTLPDQTMKRLRDLMENLPDGSPEMTEIIKYVVEMVEKGYTMVKNSKDMLINLQKQSAALENSIKENDMFLDSVDKMNDEF